MTEEEEEDFEDGVFGRFVRYMSICFDDAVGTMMTTISMISIYIYISKAMKPPLDYSRKATHLGIIFEAHGYVEDFIRDFRVQG